MHIFKVTKSSELGGGAILELYDGNNNNSDLALLESESFSDLYTLNFHLQTLATKYKTTLEPVLFIVHDKAKNSVDLSMAKDENSLFVS